MPAEVQLITGPARCGKTQRLLDHYRSRLYAKPLNRCCWLAPNHVALARIQDHLLQNSSHAFLAPNLYTFSAYADQLIARSQRHIRPVARLQKRRLLHHVIREALEQEQLDHFSLVAQTPGFATQVDEFIAELKRADVWPDLFQRWAGQRPTEDRQLRELAILYTAYQQALHRGELYDAEGRFWAAREILDKEPVASRQHHDLVVVNGFNDFTAAQYDILRLLSERCSQLLISLTVEQPHHDSHADEGRSLLFAKTNHTLTRLKRVLPQLKIHHEPTPLARSNSLQQLQQQLFRESDEPDSPKKPDSSNKKATEKFDGLEILAANSALGEIEAVAERVKSLLKTGEARPQEIVVVSRADELVTRLITEVFHDYGIPTACESRPRLEAEPLTRALLTLLHLHQEDWPFQTLLEVVNNRLFTCFDAQADPTSSFSTQPRVALEQCLRSAQLPAGKKALLEQLEYRRDLAAQQVAAQQTGTTAPRTTQVLVALRELQQLDQILSALPEQASINEWTQSLQQLLTQSGILPKQATNNSPETLAWNLLRHGLQSLALVDTWSYAEDHSLTLPKLMDLLALVAREQRLSATEDPVGRVQVLSAESARKLTVKHLFLAGLSEQSFSAPATSGETAIANQSQSLLDSLPDTLVEPVAVHVRHSDSMLLFYELATRATHSLTLSYPALDAKGQPLSPSPLLTELVRCAGTDRILQHTMPLGPVVHSDTIPHSRSTFRRQAVDQALHGKERWLAGMVSQATFVNAGSSILSGIDCIAQRAARDTFGPYEGLILSEPAQAALAQRFDTAHLWSPSQLEGYAACPFRFFAEQLLNLEPLAEMTLRNDPLRRGSLLHQVLATIHQQLSRETAGDCSRTDLEGRFLGALDTAVKAAPLRGIEQSLREIERREIEAWASDYAEQEADYRSQWKHLDEPPQPALFEIRFGPETRHSAAETSDQASTAVPFELDLGDEKICLTGQIDRVDIGRVGGVTVFNIIDYKSGKAVKLQLDKVRTGHQLQLPLYALAAEQLLLADQQAIALATGYWNIRGKGFESSRGGSLHLRELAGESLQTSADWQQLQPVILRRVQELVAGIRGGQFPVYNEDQHCTRSCSLSTVCRVSQIRSLEKVWPLPETDQEGSADA